MGRVREALRALSLLAWRPNLERFGRGRSTRRRFDPEFRAGAVRIVKETGKPVSHVARNLGVNEYTHASPRGCRRLAYGMTFARQMRPSRVGRMR
ncbi:transposase [Microtetraspora malaysiensis]|uniref:transposase n=1 Tax=Microtetraspora malaysiensis TaxID=161358 RepID=UPI000A04625B